MSKAFKCDVCGEYRDGSETIMQFNHSNLFIEPIDKADICGCCHEKILHLLVDIGNEHCFENHYIAER